LLHAPVRRGSAVPVHANESNVADDEEAVPLAYHRTRIDGAHTAGPQRFARDAAVPPLPQPAAATAAAELVVVLPVVMLHCLLGDGGAQFRLLETQLHKQLVADYHARTSASSSSSSTSPSSSSAVGAEPSAAHSSPRLVLDLYLPDLRNHGFSAHSSVHSYRALVADIRGFLAAHGLRRPLLAGHSMGGKTALAYALSLREEEVARGDDCVPRGLFILDAAPAAYTHEHTAIFAAMEHLSAATTPTDGASGAAASSSSAGSVPLLSTLRSKRDADVALRAVLPSPNDRAFVLTNLVDRMTLRATRQAMGQQHQSDYQRDFDHSHHAGFDWRVNVSTLHRCERQVHGWSLPPPPSLSLSSVGPSCPTLATCFVGGGLSSRLTTPAYIEALPGYFPDREVHMIPKAAHFVHHSHAKECAHIMLQFIQKRILPHLLTSEGGIH
jgi:pimeloyl-ACP methyl ester carboxylesterase